MNITDEELLMIEHLTYLNESVASAAKVDFNYINNKYESYTISQILARFDSTAIANLEAKGDEPLGGRGQRL